MSNGYLSEVNTDIVGLEPLLLTNMTCIHWCYMNLDTGIDLMMITSILHR